MKDFWVTSGHHLLDRDRDGRLSVTDAFLKAYLAASGAKGLILGISGGQDSSLAGRLCQIAVDELAAEGRDARFVAVRLPYGVQRDEADAQLALDFIQPAEVVDFNVKGGVDGLASDYAVSVHRRG